MSDKLRPTPPDTIAHLLDYSLEELGQHADAVEIQAMLSWLDERNMFDVNQLAEEQVALRHEADRPQLLGHARFRAQSALMHTNYDPDKARQLLGTAEFDGTPPSWLEEITCWGHHSEAEEPGLAQPETTAAQLNQQVTEQTDAGTPTPMT